MGRRRVMRRALLVVAILLIVPGIFTSASARPIDNFYACMKEGGSHKACCVGSGGTYVKVTFKGHTWEECDWGTEMAKLAVTPPSGSGGLRGLSVTFKPPIAVAVTFANRTFYVGRTIYFAP